MGKGPIWGTSQGALGSILDGQEFDKGFTRRWIDQLREGHVRSLT